MQEIEKKVRRRKGRPKWMPPDLAKVESYAARGLNDHQIAAALGICYDTLNERKKEFSDFSDAIKRGRALGLTHVSNALFESAKAGNTTAQIFFLKCQGGWKETSVVVNEHTGKDGAELPPVKFTINIPKNE